MPRTSGAILALGFWAGIVQAQLAPPDPDWKEVDAPPPPQLRTDRLVPIEISSSALRFGVHPASVAVGADGIVRYVVVATSATGAVNGLYEGIRCSTAEVRLYARHSRDRGWVQVEDSRWQPLHGNRVSGHSLAIARNGACLGSAPNQNAARVVRDLGGSPNWRFWNN
ncbi:MAG: CNP1-like family protein [Pseudomonadota bacterium]|nr:CNP1-like family protein [Pseudomonadota bacterium]